jgi:hypothetical protein
LPTHPTLAHLPSGGIFAHDTTDGPLEERLLQNTPYGRIRTPVLIAQGQIDDLVLPEVQRRFVAARCATGQPIDYRLYEGRDHLSLVAADSPPGLDLVGWTRDRQANAPASAQLQTIMKRAANPLTSGARWNRQQLVSGYRLTVASLERVWQIRTESYVGAPDTIRTCDLCFRRIRHLVSPRATTERFYRLGEPTL